MRVGSWSRSSARCSPTPRRLGATARCAPRLLPFAQESKRIAPPDAAPARLLRSAGAENRQDCLCGALAAGAVALAEAVPEAAENWLEWLLGYLRAHPPQGERGHDEQRLLRPALLLACGGPRGIAFTWRPAASCSPMGGPPTATASERTACAAALPCPEEAAADASRR